MPNYSGVWTLQEQYEAILAGNWTGIVQSGMYAWGYNNGGMLGQNDRVSRSSPTQIGTLSTWAEVSAGYAFSLAVKTDGTLWGWGRGSNGQLGTNDTIYRSSPVQIGALTTWSKVNGGSAHSAAIKTDGTLWTFGRNHIGQLGDNTIVDKSSPIQIGSATDWTIASAGYNNISAIAGGELYSWGVASQGILGVGDQVNRSSPTQVGALTTWSSVSMARSHNMAVKTDGTMWAIGGQAFFGSLGLNDTTYRSSPVQVGALTTWSKLATPNRITLGVKTDGTLWSWGRGSHGGTGLNYTTNVSSPVQVGSDTDWSTPFGGGSTGGASFCTKTNNELYVWGRNRSGMLGLGDANDRSSPVQLGALASWTTVGVGQYHSVARTYSKTGT